MIATRDPDTVVNGHIRAAARHTAQIFARARAAMPHIAWHADDDTPADEMGQDCPTHGPYADEECPKA